MTSQRKVSPAQFAKLLGKSRTSVMALIAAGEVRATDERNPGSGKPRYRIPLEEADRWERSRAVAPAGSAPVPANARRVAVDPIFAQMRARRMAGQAARGR